MLIRCYSNPSLNVRKNVDLTLEWKVKFYSYLATGAATHTKPACEGYSIKSTEVDFGCVVAVLTARLFIIFLQII
jgi:hypothetical protein